MVVLLYVIVPCLAAYMYIQITGLVSLIFGTSIPTSLNKRFFTLFYKKYSVYKIYSIAMHYLQWNYITVPSFMFRYVTVSELGLFKGKKKKMERLL